MLPDELGLEPEFGDGDSGVDESYCCRDIDVDYGGGEHSRSVD